MMYDQTNGGKYLRMYNSCNLAWWHTYKQAAMTIWKRFSCEVFAPLWHNLYPGHIFYRKPSSLASVLTHLLYIHMARDHIVGDLRALLVNENVQPAHRVIVKDLDFLVNVAIPVVRMHM